LLAPDEVHVWLASLDRPSASEAATLRDLLAPDEARRADAFAAEDERRRFVVGRGLLRVLLGRYLNEAPAALRFDYGARGKPMLAGSPVRFNLSHAGGIVLYAIALGRDVGVDVERVRSLPDLARIARRFFSAWEADTLLRLPGGEREPAFFRCWTRKEAYVKALGRGLAVPLDAFDVSFTQGDAARLLRTTVDERGPERWSLSDLDPGPGYAAAVIVEGSAAPRCWRLTD
jgi:4'-phosphopantetheinyl transferase